MEKFQGKNKFAQRGNEQHLRLFSRLVGLAGR